MSHSDGMDGLEGLAIRQPSRFGWFGAGVVVAAGLILGFLFVDGYFEPAKAVDLRGETHITIPRS